MFGHNKPLFRLTVVILLFFGALSPIFRSDDVADYVGFASSLFLAGALSWVVIRTKDLR